MVQLIKIFSTFNHNFFDLICCMSNKSNELKTKYTIVIVTHSMQQAARVSQRTGFFHMGELIETGETQKIFTNPENEKTQGYITGRFG